jgi:hypothetical protein
MEFSEHHRNDVVLDLSLVFDYRNGLFQGDVGSLDLGLGVLSAEELEDQTGYLIYMLSYLIALLICNVLLEIVHKIDVVEDDVFGEEHLYFFVAERSIE